MPGKSKSKHKRQKLDSSGRNNNNNSNFGKVELESDDDAVGSTTSEFEGNEWAIDDSEEVLELESELDEPAVKTRKISGSRRSISKTKKRILTPLVEWKSKNEFDDLVCRIVSWIHYSCCNRFFSGFFCNRSLSISYCVCIFK